MTKEKKLEEVQLAARAILSIGDKLPLESENRIIDAFMRLQSPQLGGKAPIELIDDNFERVMSYMEDMYAKAVINNLPAPELEQF